MDDTQMHLNEIQMQKQNHHDTEPSDGNFATAAHAAALAAGAVIDNDSQPEGAAADRVVLPQPN